MRLVFIPLVLLNHANHCTVYIKRLRNVQKPRDKKKREPVKPMNEESVAIRKSFKDKLA